MPNRTESGRRRLESADVVRFVTIDDAQISPDGAHAAFVVKRSLLDENRYASAIQLVATDGSSGLSPRQITSGAHRDTSPRWSPDSRELAFVSDRSGTPQLYTLNFQGGEARQITTLARGVGSPAWSPDGRRVAVLSSENNGVDDATRTRPQGYIRHVKRIRYRFNELDYIDGRVNHIWVIDIESGSTDRLTFGEHGVQSLAWSPDGQTIAFTANRHDDTDASFRSQLYLVSSTPLAKTDRQSDSATAVSGSSAVAAGPAWSPDGGTIAFIGRRKDAPAGGNNEIYLASTGGGEVRCLTGDFDRSPGTSTYSDTWAPGGDTPLIWLRDGSGVLFSANDHGRTGIYRASASGGEVSHIVAGDRTIGNISISADGGQIVFAASGFTEPCDIYTCRADGSNEIRLTSLNEPLLGEVQIQQPEHITFKSFDSAYTVDAWLLRPVGYDPAQQYPLVQIIHGGPHSIFGYTFFFDMQQWANNGWNVLFINPRASQGYGEAFATACLGDWGGADWREQEMALDLVIEQGGVDRNRLAVTGLSYGGFMANWIVGHSDRYRVAVSENGIFNLVSFFTTSDIGWYWLEHEMQRTVWDNLDWYMRASPASYVEHMKTPMLLLQAESDYRCPIEQGEQLYTALRQRGVDCEMVRFPGENHVQLSNGKPETRLVRRDVTLEWLKRYL